MSPLCSEAEEEGYRGPLSESGALDLYHQLDRDDSEEEEEMEEGLGEWEGRAPSSMPVSGRGWPDGIDPTAR